MLSNQASFVSSGRCLIYIFHSFLNILLRIFTFRGGTDFRSIFPGAPQTIKMRTLQLAIAFCLSFITFGYASSTDMDDKSMVMNMVMNMSEPSWQAMESQDNKTTNELFKMCEELAHLEEFVLILSNATKLAEVEKKENLTSEQVAKLKEEATNAMVKLNELKSNTTLVKECLIVEAHLKLLHECKEIVVLIIIIDIASNQTLLLELEKETKHNLTVAQDAMLKELAANATTKLTMFEKNTTLIMDCKTLLNITLKLNTTTTATTTTKLTSTTRLSTTTATTTTKLTTTTRLSTTTATTTTKLTSTTRISTTTSSLKTTSMATANLTMTKPNTTSTSVVKLNVSATTSKILHSIQKF